MKLSICLSYDWAEKNLGVANFWVDDAGLLLRVDKIFLVVISRVWKTARATLASMLEQVCVTARIQRLDCFTTATLGENHTLMICCSLLLDGNPQFATKFDPKALVVQKLTHDKNSLQASKGKHDHLQNSSWTISKPRLDHNMKLSGKLKSFSLFVTVYWQQEFQLPQVKLFGRICGIWVTTTIIMRVINSLLYLIMMHIKQN